jgi:hypothetical protein
VGTKTNIKDNTGDNMVESDNIVAVVAISKTTDNNVVAYCSFLTIHQ